MVTPQFDNKNALKAREFAFSDEDFNALRAIVKAHTGINLTDQKRELVYGRISRRLRALDLDSFRDYRELLSDENSKEFVEFCNAITTNLTSFFRETHHFDYVRDHILVPRGASLFHHHDVAVHDMAADHGVSTHLQGKHLAVWPHPQTLHIH